MDQLYLYGAFFFFFPPQSNCLWFLDCINLHVVLAGVLELVEAVFIPSGPASKAAFAVVKEMFGIY